jgi:uncharacterized protein (DUF1501 family)
MALTRREFLCRSFGAMGAAALAFERFGLLNAFAQSSDYKALVCIFLFGGSDTGNVVIPNDDNASSPFAYASYAKARQSSGLAIPQSSLLQINPPSIAGSNFGLHPSLTSATGGLYDLWKAGKMAVVCNVGPLVEPTTRDAYIHGTAHVPVNLFSHSDQQNEWQTSIADPSKVPPAGGGWGGRTADKAIDSTATLPPLTSVAGTPIFCSGNVAQPLAIAPAPTALSAALSLDGFPNPPDNDPRYIAMTQLLQEDQAITLVKGASGVTTQALGVEKTLRTAGNPAVPPFPLNTSLGNQLNQVAKMISVRNSLQMSRQIFFCSLGGFDTHFNQVNNGNSAAGTHANLLLQLSNAMKTFYDATVNLGVASQVTTFILSDFARTFVPNGNLGTDHAWGSHHFVVGGAVRGGDFYGVPGSNGTVFPTVVANGPDDTDTGGGARGRWIPTTAVDQYGATLVSWFGVSSVDLAAVFPNIARFGSTNLGFV